MPGAVTPPVMVGFCGKLPARGDFVRSGLPRDFVDTWDSWLFGVLAETQDAAGEAWLPAFLEAPVWRFILPAGMCGTGAVVGLTMPSVDRVGRYFPLTFAAVTQRSGFVAGAALDTWLDHCEHVGREALELDLTPEAINAMLDRPTPVDTPRHDAEWWTDGSNRVAPGHMACQTLPDATIYAAMLGVPASELKSKLAG